MKIKKAFTLAEVLITMTILGVVAVLTVPALKQDSSERQYITSVKKAYNVIQSVTALIEVEHGPWDTWQAGNVVNWYRTTMNATDCSDEYQVKTMNGGNWGTMCTGSSFVTSDGMIWLFPMGINHVVVDVNGKKAPNIAGVDVHHFIINADGIAPFGSCTRDPIFRDEMPWVTDATRSCTTGDN